VVLSAPAGSLDSSASAMPEDVQLSGVRRGPFEAGERITLTDPKGRRHSVVLTVGGKFHTAKGPVSHDDLISQPEGIVVTSAGGTAFLAMRPLLNEFTVTMRRGAAVIYPKDAAQILVSADIFPGARVLEAGAGSGALTCTLLRAIGPGGHLTSYERREDFASLARRNVESFFHARPPNWELRIGDLVESLTDEPLDRVVLDMLAPWQCVTAVADVLVPGGVFCAYVTTTTQLAQTVETLRVHTGFTEPEATESLIRGWHVEGLAVRPRHNMVGHTGFVITARRMASGFTAPLRKRRPAPGAYGDDYKGPHSLPG
jgi:tRNA (adenine57-N1/adenine58-N1)-methyltransferase catalytic subunit